MKLWLARNKDGSLNLFYAKPHLVDGFFAVIYNHSYGYCIELGCDVFPEVTFENSPREAEIKLVDEIVGVAESPLKTFPRINEFEVGASYRH